MMTTSAQTVAPSSASSGPKLSEIARRIDEHLRRMEEVSPMQARGRGGYYHAGARVAGPKVGITYVSYQVTHKVTKTEALAYLAWLDAGNSGRHHTMPKAVPQAGAAE